eukprot:TRINITY_DN8007_c0_g1_i3.p1 TRINITY_DN8007_c0_g1~~TRINITY_DN8007_c0_g1_i3.p1  ORF type:complete len:586 (+),score=188.08 TRINITY_DN8007_c0_g1_i3:67-1824(+)
MCIRDRKRRSLEVSGAQNEAMLASTRLALEHSEKEVAHLSAKVARLEDSASLTALELQTKASLAERLAREGMTAREAFEQALSEKQHYFTAFRDSQRRLSAVESEAAESRRHLEEEKNRLAGRVSILEAEKQSITVEAETKSLSLSARIENLESANSGLKEELNHVLKLLQELVTRNKGVFEDKMQVEETVAKTNQLAAAVRSLTNETSLEFLRTSAGAQDLETLRGMLEEQKTLYEGLLGRKEEALAKVMAAYTLLQETHTKLLQDKDARITELTDTIRKLGQDHTTRFNTLNEIHSDQMKRLTEENDARKERLRELESRYTELQSRFDALSVEKEKVSAEQTGVQGNYSSVLGEKERLSTQKDRLEKANAELVHKLALKEVTWTEEKGLLLQQLEQLRKENQAFLEEKTYLLGKVNSRVSDKEKTSQQEKGIEEEGESEAELEKLKLEVAELRDALAKREEFTEQMRSEISAAKSGMDIEQPAGTEARLKEEILERETLAAENSRLLAKVVELEQRITESSNEKREKEQQYLTAQREVLSLQRDIQRYKEMDIDELRALIDDPNVQNAVETAVNLLNQYKNQE